MGTVREREREREIERESLVGRESVSESGDVRRGGQEGETNKQRGYEI